MVLSVKEKKDETKLPLFISRTTPIDIPYPSEILHNANKNLNKNTEGFNPTVQGAASDLDRARAKDDVVRLHEDWPINGAPRNAFLKMIINLV